MKLSTSTALIMLVPAASAGNVVDDVCKGMKNIWNCKATFDLPTGAKAKMCPNKFFKTDPCKTRTNYRYPCPTWSKPLRTCPGWTCVPGTYETWIDVPCGINIMTKRVDLCKSVRGALGNTGAQFITKSAAMCECLPKALEMVSTAAFDSISSGSDLSASVSSILGELIEVQTCMIENGFDVKDTRAQVEATDLSSDGGWLVVQAKEIDLATYGKLAAALSPCFFGACNPELIRGFFTNYLTASNNLMAETLNQVLRGWLDIFQRIEERVSRVVDAAGVLFAHVEVVPSTIKGIQDRLCTENVCLGGAALIYMEKVAQAIASIKALAQFQMNVQMAAEAAPRLAQLVETAMGLMGEIPDVEELEQLFLSEKLKRVQDIIESIQVVKTLPKVVDDIQGAAAPILGLITSFEIDGPRALAMLREVLNQSIESIDEEVQGDTARAVILDIQAVLREELEAPMQNLTDSVNSLTDVFDGAPIKKGQFRFQTGVSSYQRWSTVSMDLPCTRKKTAHYKVAGGFKGSFSYPEFYACSSGDIKIPWPNHHIPYFKFNIA